MVPALAAVGQCRPAKDSLMTEEVALVLVADDDRDFLEMTRGVLETGGYRVACARDAQAALETVMKEKPQLVITDLMMQAMDAGFSLARKIKELPGCSELPVIIVTAAASRLGYDFAPRTPEDLAAMRADAFFEKPVPPETLLAKIADLLRDRGKTDDQ